MNDFVPQIVRVTASNYEPLKRAALEDNHDAVCPSHVLYKHGEIVGYLGIGTVPTVQVWMHTTKTKVRDSLFAQAFYEEVISHTMLPNGGIMFLPTESQSPFIDYLPAAGYLKTKIDRLYVKSLPSSIGEK